MELLREKLWMPDSLRSLSGKSCIVELGTARTEVASWVVIKRGRVHDWVRVEGGTWTKV